MKLNAHVFSAMLLFFVLVSLLASPAQAVINIMPLGDSITSGSNSGTNPPDNDNSGLWISYRKDLWDTLNSAGYVVNFVGTQTSGFLVPNFDPNHEGHGGWRAFEIVDGRAGSGEGTLADWLNINQPDIVLLHIGTNDISWGSEDWNDVEDILAVIDDYESNTGKPVWVVLALIVDRSCDPFDPPCDLSPETSIFNNDVRQMVFEPRINLGDKIRLVDMQNGASIDYRQQEQTPDGDMWDALHPFETGYTKMSAKWFEALQQILPEADAGTDQNVVERNTVTLDGSGSIDPKGGTLLFKWNQTEGTQVVLTDDQTATPSFTALAPAGSSSETIAFSLTVTDEDGLEAKDSTAVTVNKSGSGGGGGGGGGGCFIATAAYALGY